MPGRKAQSRSQAGFRGRTIERMEPVFKLIFGLAITFAASKAASAGPLLRNSSRSCPATSSCSERASWIIHEPFTTGG
jgi:hypothetical protein